MAETTSSRIEQAAGDLLDYSAKGFKKDQLHLPGPDFVDRILAQSDRKPAVLCNFQRILNSGRLAKTGYVSILPVDQGLEHTAGFSFAQNTAYFDPENIVKLAIEGGCNSVASTLGVLGSVSRRYAHRIPFLVKLNHNELLTYPNKWDQILFGQVKQAFELGAAAIGATIYFGSEESTRQIEEVSQAFAQAHELGMVTVLWCYVRNPGFTVDGQNYEFAADVTGQANHLGVTIEADIIKQKLPTTNRGFEKVKFGKYGSDVYELTPGDHPIELCRYQLANCYMGRSPLINSGGGVKGESDAGESEDPFINAARTAIVNKRAGGMGLISGRKAFKCPIDRGIELLNMIQDIYLDESITIA